MRREQRADGTTTQIIRADIPKECGQHRVDHLDNAIPGSIQMPWQGASDKVSVILFVFLLRLLRVPGFHSLMRQGTMITCSLRRLGMR